MLVKLTTDRAGRGFLQLSGQVVDLPTDEARQLLAAGQAEAVGKPRLTTEPKPKQRG